VIHSEQNKTNLIEIALKTQKFLMILICHAGQYITLLPHCCG